MAVFFCNKTSIDLNAISLMGVSVKDNSKERIGYFGTGLKFSIATLLRTGHQVTLFRNGEEIQFKVVEEIIRKETFHRVVMGDEKLGFTTKLGRNWEVWQAYRELACNCIDEDGYIFQSNAQIDMMTPHFMKNGTVFCVTGDGIEKAYEERTKIFLESIPLVKMNNCEVHHGQNEHLFYRGVRAHKHSSSALFTYNVLSFLELTEDRTVKYSFYADSKIKDAIVTCDDEDFITKALMANEGYYENKLDYSEVSSKPSLAFMDVAFRLRNNGKANRTAIKLWEKNSDFRLTYSPVELDSYEESIVDKALLLIKRLGVEMTRADFTVVNGLGEGLMGTVREQRILIAHRTLDMGHRYLASTLYEEWIHLNEGLEDCSRDLQNLLFEKLFAMIERVTAMEQERKNA